MSNPIVRYIQKQLFGQKGVIANNKTVNFEAAKLAEKLSEFGVDPRLIQNEKQLQGIINQIKDPSTFLHGLQEYTKTKAGKDWEIG